MFYPETYTDRDQNKKTLLRNKKHETVPQNDIKITLASWLIWFLCASEKNVPCYTSNFTVWRIVVAS